MANVGLVDPEMALLKGSLKINKKKENNSSKTYSKTSVGEVGALNWTQELKSV